MCDCINLVHRLLVAENYTVAKDVRELFAEAAAEIERLREALANAMTLVNAFTRPGDAIADALRDQAASCGIQ